MWHLRLLCQPYVSMRWLLAAPSPLKGMSETRSTVRYFGTVPTGSKLLITTIGYMLGGPPLGSVVDTQ